MTGRTLGLGIFLSSLLFTAVAAAAPAVTLSQAAGPPTATVKVSGTGFGAFAAVDVYFDQTNMCLTFANALGNANCEIKVPKTAQPQTHWFSILQRSNSSGAQKSFIVRADWAQFHGNDARHNGYNRFENTIGKDNAVNLDILWTAAIGPTGTWSTPVIANNRVYIGGRDGKLYAFNATTGAPIAGFPRTLGGAVEHSTAAVGNGNVYIGTGAGDSKLYAFNANTGTPVPGFPKQLLNAVYSSPVLALGNVYVGDFNGNLWAFNATTGVVLPGFPVGVFGGIFGSPTISGGRLYISTNNSRIYAFDAMTGSPNTIDSVIVGASISSIAAANGQVYGASTGLNGEQILYGLDRNLEFDTTYFPIGLGTTPGFNYSTPAVVGATIFVGKPATSVSAFRFNAGSSALWTRNFINPTQGSPVVANGLVFVNATKTLFALDASNGTILWSSAVRTAEFASPAVVNGIVYIGSTDGFLYAYSENGEPPSARLAGGELGVKSALSGLKPDLRLKALRTRD